MTWQSELAKELHTQPTTGRLSMFIEELENTEVSKELAIQRLLELHLNYFASLVDNGVYDERLKEVSNESNAN